MSDASHPLTAVSAVLGAVLLVLLVLGAGMILALGLVASRLRRQLARPSLDHASA